MSLGLFQQIMSRTSYSAVDGGELDVRIFCHDAGSILAGMIYGCFRRGCEAIIGQTLAYFSISIVGSVNLSATL